LSLETSFAAATEVLAQADKDLANTETLLAERQVAQAAMQAAAAEATHGQQDNESDASALRIRDQDFRDRSSALETVVSTANSEIGELAETIDQLSDELSRVGGSGRESSESEARLAALDATLTAGVSRVEELNLQDRSRSTAATTARAEVDTVKHSLIDVEQGLADVEDALKSIEPESTDNSEIDAGHVRTLEAQALDARLDLQRLEFQAGQRAGEQERAEAAVAMAQRETERLAERCQEIRGQARYEFGEDNLDPVKSSDPVGGIERRIAELRRMLETLGPVNPLAPAEYASERKRVEEARRQIDDLEGAAHNLHTLARDLHQQLHDEFMTTFDAINDAFGDVFTELFGGGSARMELTSPEDVEQTGVEFSIKLPGKRTQELAVLSGGERALVGAALILALLRVRPAPFCLLDEVDAALDDQNVARFCQQIDDLSTRTQMMMITHNAVTVEAASTVYGVTMREDGVSELLSVRLDEVGTNADGVGGLSQKPAPPVAASGTRDGVS
jgi:chromosome segregation protein